MDTEARIAALEREVKTLRVVLESRCDFLSAENISRFEMSVWICDQLRLLRGDLNAAEDRLDADEHRLGVADVKFDILGNIVWPTYYKVFPDMAEVDRLMFDNASKKSKKEDEG